MTTRLPEFDAYDRRRIDVGDQVDIHVRFKMHADRQAPVLLLVHGFPQSHAMWAPVLGALETHYSIVCPDLRGYGDSGKPAGLPDHSNYSKRVMARDLVRVMAQIANGPFHLVGHDRGARVAHRLALDHGALVKSLALLDICPTLAMYDATDMAFARAYWHWFFLIQPHPLPERLIAPQATQLLRQFLGGWGGSGSGPCSQAAMAEYERTWANMEAIHASCEDYRASASIDLDDDRASYARGERIRVPLHLIWGSRGVVGRLFDPPGIWSRYTEGPLTWTSIDAGHFLVEEQPGQVAADLLQFLRKVE